MFCFCQDWNSDHNEIQSINSTICHGFVTKNVHFHCNKFILLQVENVRWPDVYSKHLKHFHSFYSIVLYFAIQLDNYEIRPGKRIKVNISVAKVRLFVGNIPKQRSREEIMAEFSKISGELERLCKLWCFVIWLNNGW